MVWRNISLIAFGCLMLLGCKRQGDVVTDDTDETDEDTDTDTSTLEAEPASEIQITAIEVNQAIGVLVWENGQAIPEAQREVPLIAGRDATVRLLWDIPDTFEVRDVTAILSVHRGGETDELTDTRTIRSASNRDVYNGTWNFELDGDWVQADTSLSVALFEQPGRPGATADNLTPTQGDIALDPWTDEMRLKVKAFPCWMPCARDDWGTRGEALPITADQKLSAEHMLMNLFPIQTLDMTWDDTPFEVDACSNTGALDAMQTRRASEGAGPETYYHCVFRQSYDSFLAGGYGWILTDEPGEPRVSFSVNWWGPNEELLTNVAHEIGHNHGRNHPWTDASWSPAAASETGCRSSWGLGIRPGPFPTETRHPLLSDPTEMVLPPVKDLTSCEYNDENTTSPPNSGDVMSYTFPHWVDPYTYNAFAERIRTVSRFDGGGSADSATSKRTLFASFTEEGGLRWTWGYGALGAQDPLGSEYVTVKTDSGRSIRVPIRPRRGSNGEIAGFSMPVPEETLVQTATGRLWRGAIHGEYRGHAIHIRIQDLALNP